MSLFAVLRKLREEKFLGGAKPARGGRGAKENSGALHIFFQTAKSLHYLLFLKIDRERS
jgi:hypothetical protein